MPSRVPLAACEFMNSKKSHFRTVLKQHAVSIVLYNLVADAIEDSHEDQRPVFKLILRHEQDSLRKDRFGNLGAHALSMQISALRITKKKLRLHTWYHPRKPSCFQTRARMSKAPTWCWPFLWCAACTGGGTSCCSSEESASAERACIRTFAMIYG